VLLRQGYLCSQRERVVRVRIEGGRGVLTIKGANQGASRGEWEYEIPVAEAAELLDSLCERPLIEKYRRRIVHGAHVWEVDEFLGANAGLVVAEIELSVEDEAFDKPDWVGEEVTADVRYLNSNLISHPYTAW
jgi:adenylate cyclase